MAQIFDLTVDSFANRFITKYVLKYIFITSDSGGFDREIGGMNDDRRAVEVTAFSTAFLQKAFLSKKRIGAPSASISAKSAAVSKAERSANASPTAAKTAVRALIAAAVFLIGFAAVFACGDAVKSGISAGIELCLGVLVPSLFLPLVLCAFLQCSGAAAWFGRALTRLPFQFFRREGMSLCIFMISLISGYPAGAFLSRAMYDAGEIDRETARRLPLCCVCAGPAFIVIGVGEGLLSSRRLGLILLGVHAAAAVVLYLALFARRRYRGGESDMRRKAARTAACSYKDKAAPMPRSLPPIGLVGGAVRAVRSACSSILTICAYTVIFSALTAVAGALGGADFGRIFAAFGEVTNACIGLCKTGNLPLIAAALGFAGMSVVAQVCAAMGDLASLPKILLFRGINAALSYAICAAVLAVMPQGGVQTAAAVAASGGAAFYASADTMALSAVLILSAVLLTASMYFPQNRCIADFF